MKSATDDASIVCVSPPRQTPLVSRHVAQLISVAKAFASATGGISHVSNVRAVSLIITLACLDPSHSTFTSLNALDSLSGPVLSASTHSDAKNHLPSSARLNSIRLNGPPFSLPCRGGPPTLKKPLRLLPTFQTVTQPSASETVRTRRPSGEKLTHETAVLCGSRT